MSVKYVIKAWKRGWWIFNYYYQSIEFDKNSKANIENIVYNLNSLGYSGITVTHIEETDVTADFRKEGEG